MSSTTLHGQKVAAISAKLKKCYQEKKKVRIYHGSTNSTRKQVFEKDAIIDISNFNSVLVIDEKEQFVLVEPNVPMDVLVKTTLSYGLIPPVVMEFPGITVGGGIQGGAGESSSFKWGAFHHSCLSYEIVLGNGEIVTVSPQQLSDLFYGTACSYGTLGVITQIKLRLIPAKKFVCLTYYRTNSFANAITCIEENIKKPIDFIDGILFTKDLGVMMTGVLSDKKENFSVETFQHAYDDWFYLHAQKIVQKYTLWTENIPLEDYLFRYNRGGFWVGKYAFTKLHISFNRLTRFLMDSLFHTRTLYRFLHAINISQRQIVQDICMPKETTQEFLEYNEKDIHIYPIWLCPLKFMLKESKLSPGLLTTKLIIDVGIWGRVPGDFSQLISFNKEIEKKVDLLGGRKVLYAHAYYTEKEFWNIYDKKWYMKLRKKYFADFVFPDIFTKTHVTKQYTVSIWKGLLELLRSPWKLPVS